MTKVRRHFVPSVRKTNGLVVYFKDKETVQVQYGDIYVLFHRWMVKTPNFYAKNWRPFCEKLQKSNNLYTIWDVMDLSVKHAISSQSPVHPYSIPNNLSRRPAKFGRIAVARTNNHRQSNQKGEKTLYELIKEEKSRRHHLF